jgi:hypothetical protein
MYVHFFNIVSIGSEFQQGIVISYVQKQNIQQTSFSWVYCVNRVVPYWDDIKVLPGAGKI